MKPEYPPPRLATPGDLTSLEGLLGFLEESCTAQGWPLYVALLTCTGDLRTVLHRWGTFYEATDLGLLPSAWVLDVPRRPKCDGHAQWFLIDYCPGAALLISNEHRDVLRAPLRKWVQRYQPILTPILLNTAAMRRVLGRASRLRGLSGDIMVTQVSVRARLPAPTPRRFIESSHTWTDRPFSGVFDEMAESRRWATSVHFSLMYEPAGGAGLHRVEGSMSRNGEFTSVACVRCLLDTVIAAAAEEAAEEREFFQGRATEDSPTGHFKPLVVQYDDPVFEDRTQNRVLIRVLESLPSAGVSVLHPNPYLRAAVVDYVDGSAYDVCVVRHDRITIVPKTRASAAALERLCAHICSDFRDGEIRDYEEVVAEDLRDDG